MPDLNDQHHDQFLRLFAEHEPALRTFVRSLMPSRGDASEVMQEVAVVLWQKFAEFDTTRDFRKWAFGVARFEALTVLRDKVRDRHLFDDELVNKLADEAAVAEQRHGTQREALDHCLQKLPAALREVVLAAYTKGTRMDELAARRGQTAMSLYKMLHRIRQTLLECVRRTIAREELA
jgi:RNA polymerase sigma-70 factor (ECF subfamily)